MHGLCGPQLRPTTRLQICHHCMYQQRYLPSRYLALLKYCFCALNAIFSSHPKRFNGTIISVSILIQERYRYRYASFGFLMCCEKSEKSGYVYGVGSVSGFS